MQQKTNIYRNNLGTMETKNDIPEEQRKNSKNGQNAFDALNKSKIKNKIYLKNAKFN